MLLNVHMKKEVYGGIGERIKVEVIGDNGVLFTHLVELHNVDKFVFDLESMLQKLGNEVQITSDDRKF